VHEGLRSSDRIVVSGVQRVRPGITVDVTERPAQQPTAEPTGQAKDEPVHEDPAP
jgi:hypothetical protein